MKRMLSASFVSAIIALLCIMDAGVPIYGYQVILDPVKFTEMELAGENYDIHIRNSNKRFSLIKAAQIYDTKGSNQSPSFAGFDPIFKLRKRRNPSPLALPLAFASPNAFAEPGPAPLPLLKKYGYLSSPGGYSFIGPDEGVRQAGSVQSSEA